MARRKSAHLLEAKLEEAERLKAEIRKLKNAARDKRREEDELRGKIIGRVVLAHITAQPESELATAVRQLLAREIRRPAERMLFPDLAGIAEPTPSDSEDGKAA